jgi:hypothetical protein
MTRIDEAALERILKTTFGQCVPDIAGDGRGELIARLNWIASAHRIGAALRTEPDRRGRLAERIRARASKLQKLVEEYYAGLGPALAEPQPHSAALDRLIYATEADALPYTQIAEAEGSGFEAGVHQLRSAFEFFFQRRGGYTRIEDEQTRGQVINFIEAALKEMGILNNGEPYHRRAIESALTRLNRAAR